jgi:hypothetical protein
MPSFVSLYDVALRELCNEETFEALVALLQLRELPSKALAVV